MDLAVPFVALFYGAQFCQNVHLSEDFIQFDFSLQHLGLLEPKQANLLKKIESKWIKETNKEGDSILTQFQFDDNLFNSIFSSFTTIDRMFSVRKIFKG
jgi:hypothetical protein